MLRAAVACGADCNIELFLGAVGWADGCNDSVCGKPACLVFRGGNRRGNSTIWVSPLFLVAIPKFRYRLTRIKTWLDPWADPTGDGFQTIQSLYALASGGLFGLGLGQSRQKTFIPEAYNDIIFAIICEELGIVGAALVILLFAVLIWRGIRIAMNAKDSYGMLVATGITAVIAFQSIINIGVVTNTIPNTGQPLPFISYGGTSLLFLMAMVGMLLNISRYPKDREN